MIRLTSFATPRRPSSAARRAPGRPVAFDAHPHGLEVDCADCGRLLIATHHGLDVLRLESGTVDLTSERHDDLTPTDTPKLGG
jgi:hypothetical protein